MAKHRNPVFRPLIKFSIYAAVCLLLLFVLAARVGNLTPPTHHRAMYHAVLSDAESLVPKDDVKIAGVTVGQVHGVQVHQDKAFVTFSVDSNLKLREGTAAGLRWQNIIGAKYLYLYPSTDGAVLKHGTTLTNEVKGADVGNFLIDVGGFLKALNPADVNAFTRSIVTALQDNGAQVSSLLNNTATVSQTLGGLDVNIQHIVDNLSGVLSALQARDADLAQVIDHLASVSSNLAANNDVIDNVIANFTSVNTDLSKLVTDNSTNVDQITANLQTVADVIQRHTTDLDKGLTTASAGLASYIQISKLGQWFAIRVVYACLAGQKTCSYDQPLHQPATLANPPLNPVPGSTAGASAAKPGSVTTAGPVASTVVGVLTPTSAGLDSGARPIGPPIPRATVGNIVGFALYGDGSQP